MWGLLGVGAGEDGRQRGVAFGPHIDVGDKAPARALGMTAGPFRRLHLPGFGKQLPNVYILSGHDLVDQLRGNRVKPRQACQLRR